MVTVAEAPKGYKKTEVGIIPEDWEIKKCAELGSFYKGKGISSKNLVSDGLPCIMYGDIYVKFDTKFSNPDFRIAKETAVKSSLAKTGDLFFTGSGETAEEIGKCVVYQGNDDIYIGGDIIALTPNSDNDSLFLAYMQNSKILLSQKANLGQGHTVVHIYTGHIKSLKIPLPPTKVEQKTIATVLSDVDKLIANLDELLAKKRNVKQGAMQELLTGRKRLPGFSGDWETKKLGEIGKFRGGSGFSIKYQGNIDGDYPFFKVSDMNNQGNQIFMVNSNNWINKNVRKQIGANIFPKHTIVFAKIGAAIFLERKKILNRESCADNNMMGFIYDEDNINHRFMHYLFLTIQLGKLVSATALPSLNGKEIAELQFDVPKPEEQSAIAQVLSDMDSEIDELEQKLDKYKAIKQGMMQELLTGKTRLI